MTSLDSYGFPVRRPGPAQRAVRLVVAFVLATGAAVGFAFATPVVAHAVDDQVDNLDINYTMQPDGVLKVKETVAWRFGSDSGRHGIKLNYITREKYDDTQDAVYAISNINVDSPDPVSTTYDRSDDEQQSGRLVVTTLKIGDPNQTVDADTATYTVSFDLTGAMRTFPDKKPPYDEFYWDAIGTGFPLIKKATVTATVPGGAQNATCFAGEVQAKTDCQTDDFTKGGKATFGQSNLAPNTGMTIGVQITPGLVSDNKPHLVPDGSKMTTEEKVGTAVLAGLGGLLLIGSPLVGALWWRKHGRDQRYAGLAPGTVPLAGQPSHIVPNDPDLPIPVAFSPPKIPVAEAGLLIDGQVDARETAATIIDLAVRGALKVQSSGEDEFSVTLVDPNRASAPHEMVLLSTLFNGQPPGAVRDLSTQGSLLTAHEAMRDAVRNQVATRGWFRKVPSATATRSFGFGAVALAIFGVFGLGAWVLWIVLPLVPILITVAVIRSKLRRGQRTADGRAMCDQVEGFKTYLATAEADQLRFEEGEDIFSRYLPWAIAFELADRWAKICGDLVAMGRLPDVTPYWYIGSYNMAAFNTTFLTSSLTTAATAVPSVSSGSSGSGFGGGSSFGGGGFVGGGGGGGGGSSW